MASVIPPDSTAYFIHVMKTGGTSFVQHARVNVPDHQRLPIDDPGASEGSGRYGKAGWLLKLTDDDRAKVRFASGHWPYVVRECLGADLTLTVLRHPVERTVSFLRHARKHHPEFRGKPLRAIYEDWHQYGFFIYDYQVRQFAKRLDDNLNHIAVIYIDPVRMALAKENLARVDVLGLHDRYDEWEKAAHDVLGWPHEERPRLQVSDHSEDIDDGLRAKIETDNATDIAFYEYAVELYEQRGGPLAPHLGAAADPTS